MFVTVNFCETYNIQETRDKNITIDTNVAIPHNLAIDETEMNIILGKLIDNVIEAAGKMKGKMYN